jgi:predicted branched-subunit amino acid permease
MPDARSSDAPGFAAAFRKGAIASVPTFIAIGPFGAIFGTLATATGLDLVQTMGMTMVVAAGASQLAALQLMDEGAPALVAILTGAVVNLRMAMYSAALAAAWPGAPLRQRAFAAYFLHDQAFALAMRRYAERPAEPVPARVGYFLGVGITVITVWFAATLVGALFGARVPAAWGLDFAVPATFIAITAPLLRTLPHVVAALTAAVLAVVGTLLPLGVGLLLASAGGIAAGLLTERSLAR